MKALNYLDHTQDSVGYQKVMEKLSAPRVRYQAAGMVQAAQKVHDAGCQDVVRAWHYDGMWYRRVGKWLQYMAKAYQSWVHEVDLAHHVLGLRHALTRKVYKGAQKHHVNAPTPHPGFAYLVYTIPTAAMLVG